MSSPESFHWWVGAALVACALDRKVSLDQWSYKLYPNLFLLLVAPTGKCHKSTAINKGFALFHDAMPLWSYKFFGQKASPEALIDAFERSKKTSRENASVIVKVGEFSTLFGSAKRDPTMLHVLTDLYDCADMPWVYETVTRGVKRIDRPYINVVGGTTPVWLQDALPTHALYGGFASRILFIAEDTARNEWSARRIAREAKRLEDELRPLHDALVDDLQEVAKLSGEFHLTEEGEVWYEEWREDVLANVVVTDELQGYWSRRGDTLLKVAMLCSAGRDDTLLVGPSDLREADERLKQVERNLHQIVAAIHMSDTSIKVETVRKRIAAMGVRGAQCTYAKLLRSVSGVLMAHELRAILATLIDSGEVAKDESGGFRLQEENSE